MFALCGGVFARLLPGFEPFFPLADVNRVKGGGIGFVEGRAAVGLLWGCFWKLSRLKRSEAITESFDGKSAIECGSFDGKLAPAAGYD